MMPVGIRNSSSTQDTCCRPIVYIHAQLIVVSAVAEGGTSKWARWVIHSPMNKGEVVGSSSLKPTRESKVPCPEVEARKGGVPEGLTIGSRWTDTVAYYSSNGRGGVYVSQVVAPM